MRTLTAGLILAVMLVASSTTIAQEATANKEVEPRHDGWEYKSAIGELTPQQIIRQKAQVRAAQRMTRMQSLQWYGYSAARPRTSATPFTGMYGGQWQGDWFSRPQAWHVARNPNLRPTVYVGY